MRNSTIALALLSFCGVAQAGNSALEKDLLARGMTEVQPGLYQSADKYSERLVAVNQAGFNALADRALERAESLRASMGKNGITQSEQQLIDGLMATADRFRADAKQVYDYDQDPGGCSSGAQILSTASAYYGTESSAWAAVTLDFGPTTPTSNWAYASTDQGSASDSQTGLTPASVFQFAGYSCYSTAHSSVSCPGGGGVASSAYSQHPGAPYSCYAP